MLGPPLQGVIKHTVEVFARQSPDQFNHAVFDRFFVLRIFGQHDGDCIPTARPNPIDGDVLTPTEN
jgi:hypothetical protein